MGTPDKYEAGQVWLRNGDADLPFIVVHLNGEGLYQAWFTLNDITLNVSKEIPLYTRDCSSDKYLFSINGEEIENAIKDSLQRDESSS